MSLGPRLDLRQSQSLVMTPQLRQAIKLLQFNNLEVNAFIAEEIERNPLLETDDRGDAIGERPALDQRADVTFSDSADAVANGAIASDAGLDQTAAETFDPGGVADGGSLYAGLGKGGGEFSDDLGGIDAMPAPKPGLRDHLSEQMRLGFAGRIDRAIAVHLIALLCPAGRLTAAPGAIADALGVTLDRLEAVRAKMMRFDPVGCFAIDLRECMAVQLAERNRLDPAMVALLDNLDLVARRDHRGLLAACEVDAEDLTEMIAELRALDPKPGARFDAPPAETRIADILMRPAAKTAEGGGWLLELNPDTLPRVLVNRTFYTHVAGAGGREAKTFLTERLQTANWLVKSLEQRAQTILKVAAEIVRQQDGFFERGVGGLRPLILRDIADAVEMHESTVSRVTSGKHIQTPRGLFELKYFFTTAIQGTDGNTHSAESVRHRIRSLIEGEADDVLSDDTLVLMLKREGVDIARRTVAKYREALRIPSSVRRKRERMPA